MRINDQDITELRGMPYQRRFFVLQNLSVVTAWFDGRGALRLTIANKPSTITKEVTEGEGVGRVNGP